MLNIWPYFWNQQLSVCLSSLQLLNQTVARVMRTVLQTRPVSGRNVQTLAQERVKRTTSARLGIIWLPATNAMIWVSFDLCVWRIMNILFVIFVKDVRTVEIGRNLTSSEWSNFKECFVFWMSLADNSVYHILYTNLTYGGNQIFIPIHAEFYPCTNTKLFWRRRI